MTRRFSASDLVLIAGATLRLTRFVTSDWLGEWALGAPAKKWAATHEDAAQGEVGRQLHLANPTRPLEEIVASVDDKVVWEGPITWQAKLVKGLDCPFCVGFWIGVAIIIGTATIGKLPVLGTIWRIALGALGLNYLVGHLSSRID